MLAGTAAQAQVLSLNALQDDPDGMPGEYALRQVINVGRGIKLTAVIEQTSKGNGLLTLGALKLKVLDEHDDGAVYAGAMPHVEFVDMDADGVKELIVNGIVEYTDEKIDSVRERESFVFIYRYDLESRSFELAYRHASFALEDGPSSRP